MHRRVFISLLWSSQIQPILGIREPGTGRTRVLAVPSHTGTILQGLRTVGRTRASNGARWQPWHGKQRAGAGVLSGAAGDGAGSCRCHGVCWDWAHGQGLGGGPRESWARLEKPIPPLRDPATLCFNLFLYPVPVGLRLLSWCIPVPSQSLGSYLQPAHIFFHLCRTLLSVRYSSQPLENQCYSVLKLAYQVPDVQMFIFSLFFYGRHFVAKNKIIYLKLRFPARFSLWLIGEMLHKDIY